MAAYLPGSVHLPGSRPARLVRWLVRPGQTIRSGSALAVLAPLGAPGPSGPDVQPQERLRAESGGLVAQLCFQAEQVVEPGAVLLTLEPCRHPVVMKGLCAECGQDLALLMKARNNTGFAANISMVHSVPELLVNPEQAKRLGLEDQERLRRGNKLVLMVDLDQTLIHTTEMISAHVGGQGIFHFQLGRGQPMLRTKVRPHCQPFLENISRLYELHVVTFGSRLYAHTIAGFLDPEKRFFSHRILSRDECINPFTKTGNLKNLFPCGDSMVCIIDDREDVWRGATNLVTVKKYAYFQGTGDINAPQDRSLVPTTHKVGDRTSGLSAAGNATRGNQPKNVTSVTTQERLPTHTIEEGEPVAKLVLEAVVADDQKSGNGTSGVSESLSTPEGSGLVDKEQELGEKNNFVGNLAATGEDFQLSSDSEQSETGDKVKKQNMVGGIKENNCELSPGKESGQPLLDNVGGECGNNGIDRNEGLIEQDGLAEEKLATTVCDSGVQERDGNGQSTTRNAVGPQKPSSHNMQQSDISDCDSFPFDESIGSEPVSTKENDDDDFLLHLEDILRRIHSAFYDVQRRYESGATKEQPDLRRIIPALRLAVLTGVSLSFSGLFPTNMPTERCREQQLALSLGAHVTRTLTFSLSEPMPTTHLVAVKIGTEKVRKALESKRVHVVTPEWLWSCGERWERVDEKLFPLTEFYVHCRPSSPAALPNPAPGSLQMPLFHPTPLHPRGPNEGGPAAPLSLGVYNPVTGKLIRRQSSTDRQVQQKTSGETFGPIGHAPCSAFRSPTDHGDDGDEKRRNDDMPLACSLIEREDEGNDQRMDENDREVCKGDMAGPSQRCPRQRQPSLSETMPLYTLSKDELDSMDREVDDILGEESEGGSNGEDEEDYYQGIERKNTAIMEGLIERPPSSSSSGGSMQRGKKRKLVETGAGEESSSCGAGEGDEDGSSSEADEMAAALEEKLDNLM
uniref:RNA polymerase II subunit A C-terminal domain phosphatase n=1 Tax=Myxine glutinosa TaxID=7769 RepID=UPI00358FEBAD